MPLLARLILAALAGVAVGVSFEPHGLVFLLPFALAGLTLLCRGTSMRRGFLIGTVFGSAFMVTLLPWLQVIGDDAWILLSVVEGLFYGLLGLGAVAVMRLPAWPVWVAVLWVGVEALRGAFPFGGFPWGRLAFATVDTPLQALFAYVGSGGVTFAVALLGSSVAWAALHVRRAPLRAAAAVTVAGVITSLAAVFPWDPAMNGRSVTVAAVQGNVPGQGLEAFAERRAVLNNHVNATLGYAADIAGGKADPPDLVIWPENSTDIDPYADPTVFSDIQGAVDAVGVPVLVGAMIGGPGPGQVQNEGIVWHPGTGPGQHYSKMHPVPFGEYIPFRDLIAKFVTRLDLIPLDMAPGERPGLLDVGGVPVGDVICFEVAYDGLLRTVVKRGAGLVVVQTNNATYIGTGQVAQQFAISRLRAIETGRYVVVAATNGLSGIVAPDGSVTEQAAPRTQAVLVGDVRLSSVLTPAVRWGGALEQVLTLLAAVSVSAGIGISYRRRRLAHQRASDSTGDDTGDNTGEGHA